MIGSRDARRAALYRQLAALEDAGIPLRTALERVVEPDLEPVGRALDEGLGAGEAWSKAGRFTPLEVTLVRAGSKSGQLSECFHSLSEVFEGTSKVKLGLLAGLAYPFVLIHIAFLVPKLYLFFKEGGGTGAYLKASVLPLAGLYAGVFVAYVVWRAFSSASPAAAGTLLQSIPLLGGYLRRTALAHGIGTLVVVYKAGVPVTDAVDAAASASTLYSVSSGFRRIRERLDNGSTIGEAFLKETTFPPDVREAASVGSVTGKLDEQLLGVKRRLENEAGTQKALMITLVPVLTYLIVAAAIGYMVISFWTDMYGSQLDSLLK